MPHLRNQRLILVDGGKQSRSFTYIDDGIEALEKIIFHKNIKKINGNIFNIGNPKNSCSIKKLASLMRVIYNKNSINKYTEKIISKNQIKFYGKGYEDIQYRSPDISKAKYYLN